MELKIDIINDFKDMTIEKCYDVRSNILKKLEENGFIEVSSGHASVDCLVVRTPKTYEEKMQLRLKKITAERNRLNRRISLLKRKTYKQKEGFDYDVFSQCCGCGSDLNADGENIDFKLGNVKEHCTACGGA